MSLSLLEGYSSAEEEEAKHDSAGDDDNDLSSSSDREGGVNNRPVLSYKSVLEQSSYDPKSSTSGGLPSAFDAFSEISGPPQFLNNCVDENTTARDIDQGIEHGRSRKRRDKQDLPPGAVMEAKPQLVGIHERVRSDVEASQPPNSAVAGTVLEGGKRAPTAANPSAEDAAELLRMCSQCGIPKTYSSARGMVCPVCGDRPPTDPGKDQKKKGSTIKDKEKNKRMKGQSSHATWKSETEMQLRQQFD